MMSTKMASVIVHLGKQRPIDGRQVDTRSSALRALTASVVFSLNTACDFHGATTVETERMTKIAHIVIVN